MNSWPPPPCFPTRRALRCACPPKKKSPGARPINFSSATSTTKRENWRRPSPPTGAVSKRSRSMPMLASISAPRTSHPKWDGQPIPGKTLMIHTEQGVGDAIQFARYLPLAAERGGKLIAGCPPDLMPLFATLPGVAELRETGRIGVAEFDAYLPLLSLAH